MQKDVPSYNASHNSFVEVPEEDRDYLQFFAFICSLSFDVYVKKLLIEKLMDDLPELIHSKRENSNKDRKKKK